MVSGSLPSCKTNSELLEFFKIFVQTLYVNMQHEKIIGVIMLVTG